MGWAKIPENWQPSTADSPPPNGSQAKQTHRPAFPTLEGGSRTDGLLRPVLPPTPDDVLTPDDDRPTPFSQQQRRKPTQSATSKKIEATAIQKTDQKSACALTRSQISMAPRNSNKRGRSLLCLEGKKPSPQTVGHPGHHKTETVPAPLPVLASALRQHSKGTIGSAGLCPFLFDWFFPVVLAACRINVF